jgi:hypothetical protein
VLVLNELYFWTLSIVWCLKKLRNKIYIPKNHNTRFQNSHKGQLLTTQLLTWVHTQYKPLKQVRHRWQQMTQPLQTSQLLKPGKHKYRIQTKALWLVIDPCVNFGRVYCDFLVYIFLFLNFLRHQMVDKVQKYNSFNTNTPSSESYRN